MTKYVGFCYDSGGWDGDLTGVLCRQDAEKLVRVSSHISSNLPWSEHDIRGHFERRMPFNVTDTFEWLGLLDASAVEWLEGLRLFRDTETT